MLVISILIRTLILIAIDNYVNTINFYNFIIKSFLIVISINDSAVYPCVSTHIIVKTRNPIMYNTTIDYIINYNQLRLNQTTHSMTMTISNLVDIILENINKNRINEQSERHICIYFENGVYIYLYNTNGYCISSEYNGDIYMDINSDKYPAIDIIESLQKKV